MCSICEKNTQIIRKYGWRFVEKSLFIMIVYVKK